MSVPLITHADRHISGWLNVCGRHNQLGKHKNAEPSQFGGTISKAQLHNAAAERLVFTEGRM